MRVYCWKCNAQIRMSSQGRLHKHQTAGGTGVCPASRTKPRGCREVRHRSEFQLPPLRLRRVHTPVQIGNEGQFIVWDENLQIYVNASPPTEYWDNATLEEIEE